jgi:lysozyme family protein
MKEDYQEALDRLLEHEGGYSNDVGDPGGPTKYGITIHDVRMYINRNAQQREMFAILRLIKPRKSIGQNIGPR